MLTVEIIHKPPRVIDGAGRTTGGEFVVGGKSFWYSGFVEFPDDPESVAECEAEYRAAHGAALCHALSLTAQA